MTSRPNFGNGQNVRKKANAARSDHNQSGRKNGDHRLPAPRSLKSKSSSSDVLLLFDIAWAALILSKYFSVHPANGPPADFASPIISPWYLNKSPRLLLKMIAFG